MDGPVGFVPVEWSQDDEAQPVAIAHFDFASLDTLEDIARERLSSGQPLTPLLEDAALAILCTGPATLVRKLTSRIYKLAGAETTARFLALIIDAEDPHWRANAIAHCIGSSVLGGESVPCTAKRFGRSKQALFQEMDRVRMALGLDLPRSNQRSDEAREKMRMRNKRWGNG